MKIKKKTIKEFIPVPVILVQNKPYLLILSFVTSYFSRLLHWWKYPVHFYENPNYFSSSFYISYFLSPRILLYFLASCHGPTGRLQSKWNIGPEGFLLRQYWFFGSVNCLNCTILFYIFSVFETRKRFSYHMCVFCTKKLILPVLCNFTVCK